MYKSKVMIPLPQGFPHNPRPSLRSTPTWTVSLAAALPAWRRTPWDGACHPTASWGHPRCGNRGEARDWGEKLVVTEGDVLKKDGG